MKFVTVTIGDDDLELPNESLLVDINVDNPNALPFRCKKGICGSCRIEVIAGHENLCAPSDEENKFVERLGYSTKTMRLACQVRVGGDIKIRPCKEYRSATSTK